MIDRANVIKGLECCSQKKVCIYDDTLKECPYWERCGKHEDAFEDCTSALAQDALALLKAQSEELDRLKLCRHNCKIECLLDEYNKVVAERDALRKAQEPRVMSLGEVLELKFDDVVFVELYPTKAILSAIVVDVISKIPILGIGVLQLRHGGGYNGINNAELGYYGKTWRCWTSRPTDEQRRDTPWQN